MDKSLILTKAKAAVMSHDFQTAARLYKDLLRDDPSNVDYLKQLGSIYVQAQQDEKAIPYYQQIITFYPHYVEAMNSLGAIYRRLKRYPESIEILQKALDEDRQLPTVNYNLGFTYKEMGNYQDAIEAFEMVIEANPDDVLAYNHLGSIYLAQKDYQKSIASYKRGLQIDRNHPILNYNLARAYQASGNENEAIRCYQSTLKTRPGWKDCISDYSGLLLKCQKNKEAQDLVNQAIKLHPTDTDLLSILGTIYLNEYDYEKAESTFKKANAIKGNDVKILTGLAEALEKGEKVENALDTVLTALEVEPENKDIKKQYVHTLLSAEDYEKAYDNVKELYDEGGEHDVQVLDLYGQYYITQNEEEKAKDYYSKIEHINGKYKEYQVNAAQRFNQIGNYDSAEAYAKEYVKHRPQSAEGYNMLGKISTNKGDLASAKFYYSKSKEVKKPNALADKQIQNLTDKILNAELPQNDFMPPEDVSLAEDEVVEETTEETVAEEEEAFDYAQMGGNIPLQEGLLEDDENFWGDEEEKTEEEPAEEETEEEEDEEPEEEQPQPLFGNLGDLANPDDQPFDFGDDIGNSEDEESEPEQVMEPEGTDPLDENMPEESQSDESEGTDPAFENEPEETSIPEPESEPAYDFPPQPKKQQDAAPSEPEVPPYASEQPPYAKNPASEPAPSSTDSAQENMLNRMMQEQAMRSAQQAMQAALDAQKMAEQLADEQFLLRKETENALQDALEKVKEMGEEQLQKLEMEKAEIEKAAVESVELSEEEEIESEGTDLSVEKNINEGSEVSSEDIIENLEREYLKLSPEYEDTIEPDVTFVTLEEIESAIDYAIANAPENVPFATVQEITDEIQIDVTEVPAETAPAEETEEEVPLEEVAFETVDSIVDAEETVEVPAETAPAEETEEEMPLEEVAFETVDSIVDAEETVETPAETSSDNMDEIKQTLQRIQQMLSDSQRALDNSEKIEMFKALRILGSYLPESDKNSFQSCRNRMMIDYIIAKMSGKPGLLQISQALINSGVLGDEYADRITESDSEEISNVMIKKVIIAMKEMASSLEDKDLAYSLCASADNILERLEMVGDDEKLF